MTLAMLINADADTQSPECMSGHAACVAGTN